MMNTSNPKTATAVEWLYGYICEIAVNDKNAERLKWLYEQAKAIEKQQIVDAYQAGDSDAYNLDKTESNGIHYYNEIYY